jgi:hypothetical protein
MKHDEDEPIGFRFILTLAAVAITVAICMAVF